MLAGTDAGTGVRGHEGSCRGDSAVEHHSMGRVRGGEEGHTHTHTHTLSAPSPGDDLRSKSAIRLRGQIVRSDSFWGLGCDFSAVTIRLRLRCILR